MFIATILTGRSTALADYAAQVLGSAKDLVESGAKIILRGRGIAFNVTILPATGPSSAESAGVGPSSVSAGVNGAQASKNIRASGFKARPPEMTVANTTFSARPSLAFLCDDGPTGGRNSREDSANQLEASAESSRTSR